MITGSIDPNKSKLNSPAYKGAFFDNAAVERLRAQFLKHKEKGECVIRKVNREEIESKKQLNNSLITGPELGWEKETYYLVEASFDATSVIKGYIFYCGNINPVNGNPTINNYFMGIKSKNNQDLRFNDAHYLRVIIPLTTKDEVENVPNKNKYPKDV